MTFDAIDAMREVLMQDATLFLLVGERIFGGILPEGLNPTNQGAVVINQVGGTSNSELPQNNPELQIDCWAGVNQFKLATQIYFAVYNAIAGKANLSFGINGRMLTCYEMMVPQDMIDGDLGWARKRGKFSTIMTPSNDDSPVQPSFIIDGGSIG